MEAGWPGKRACSFAEIEFTSVLYEKKTVSASGAARLYLSAHHSYAQCI